jgi:hypothetical protein
MLSDIGEHITGARGTSTFSVFPRWEEISGTASINPDSHGIVVASNVDDNDLVGLTKATQNVRSESGVFTDLGN